MALTVAFAGLVGASGCATRASVGEIQGEVSRVRTELAELRSLDARTTETQATLHESSSELARLRARLQATEEELRQAKAVSAATSPAVVIPPTALATPGDAQRRPDVVGDEPAEQAYAAALNTFRAREHGQAVLDFLDFIAKYPDHALAPSAQYWIGEAYYVQRDYQQAVVEFQRILEMAPNGPKVPDALLRIGMCHANLLAPAPAAHAWQRLVHDYPRSDAAGKARALLGGRASPRQP